MKKQASILTALLFVGSLALAADAEHSETTTVDHSKNPITGSETTTKKTKKKMKGEHAKTEMKTTDKMKKEKDGTKKMTHETETTTETK